MTDSAAPEKYEKVINECAMYNLRRLSRLTTNNLNHKLASTGMRCTQYSILLAAGARPGSTMTVLSEYLGMDISTLTRSTENLAHLGFLRFEYGNHREKFVYLTKSGEKKADEALPLWQEEQQNFINAFGQEAWDACLRAIAKYNTADKDTAAL